MIAILGGTFDPVHNGHLQIATRIFHKLGLSQMHFMPCGIPVHRREPRASEQHRCAMIDLAISAEDGLLLNRLEVEQAGLSYSVDSLRKIRQQCGGRLVLVLGSDAFNGFSAWKDPDEILRLASVIVCHRPGVVPDCDLFKEQRVESLEAFLQQSSGAVFSTEVDANRCSSTEIRLQIAGGNYDSHCLHPDVATYIKQHHLYGNSVD